MDWYHTYSELTNYNSLYRCGIWGCIVYFSDEEIDQEIRQIIQNRNKFKEEYQIIQCVHCVCHPHENYKYISYFQKYLKKMTGKIIVIMIITCIILKYIY